MKLRGILTGLATLAALVGGVVLVATPAHAERECTTRGICLYDDGAEGPFFQKETNRYVRLNPATEDNRADWARHRKAVAVRYIVNRPRFFAYLCVPASNHRAINLENFNIPGLGDNSFKNSVDAVNAQQGPLCDGHDSIRRGLVWR